MEGLTITPDGSMLVGAMQSALQQSDLAGVDPKKITVTRIVTYRLSDGAVHEYLYLLDNPATTGTAISEIAALSNTTFLMDERDGNFPPNAYKRVFSIDISGATDVGPSSTVAGATYSAGGGGLLIGGQTLESLVKNQNTNTSMTTLLGKSIVPVSKSLYADVGGLLTTVDPQGRFFSHDKLEGLAVLNGGATLVISNDSDFGIDGVTNSTPPFQLHAKTSPATGQQDDGEFLVIDAIRASATVTINVVDTTPPDTVLTSVPTNPSKSRTAIFTFQGTDNGSGVGRFQCSLDNAAFSDCSSGINYGGLIDGNHSFAVKAIDNAGNADPTPAIYAWAVDATAPIISGMPAANCSIWPPNHKLVQVGTVTAADALTGVVTGSFSVTGTSNEPPSDPGSPDIVITPGKNGGFLIQLRADRLGDGNGREYKLKATATDVAGNTAIVEATCTVPHDQGN
jgi:hypothetical protein